MKKVTVKHQWEPTDSEGYSMECEVCGLSISIYDSEEWDKHIDGECCRGDGLL